MADEQAEENGLGITQEAFDAAGEALKGVVEGQIDPGDDAPVDAAPPTPPVDAPAAPPEPGPVHKGWEAIKKAEQDNRRDREQLAAERRELKQLRDSMSKQQKEFSDAVAMLKQDPRNIEKLGIPIQEFLDRVINDNAPTPGSIKRESSEELTALRTELGEMKKLLTRRDAQDNESRFEQSANSVLQQPEFELLRSHPDAIGEMKRFVGAYYQRFGKVDLPHTKIAAILQDTWQEHLKSLGAAKAVRKVFGLPDEVQPGQEPPTPARTPAPKQKPKTVTPSMTSSPARGAAPEKELNRGRPSDIIREAAKLVSADVWDSID